jgi:hypothetical protein
LNASPEDPFSVQPRHSAGVHAAGGSGAISCAHQPSLAAKAITTSPHVWYPSNHAHLCRTRIQPRRRRTRHLGVLRSHAASLCNNARNNGAPFRSVRLSRAERIIIRGTRRFRSVIDQHANLLPRRWRPTILVRTTPALLLLPRHELHGLLSLKAPPR